MHNIFQKFFSNRLVEEEASVFASLCVSVCSHMCILFLRGSQVVWCMHVDCVYVSIHESLIGVPISRLPLSKWICVNFRIKLGKICAISLR